MNAADQVFDSKGTLIACLSIVGMRETGPWSDHQGIVLAPFSEMEGDGYTVAVFFGTEVAHHKFNSPFRDIRDWDNTYGKDLEIGDYSFLLKDELWKKCPRVVFFQPGELVVQEGWSILTLAERLFSNNYHSVYRWSRGISPTSSLYRCFLKECQSTATKVALFNASGSVCPLHVCDECSGETNGWYGDIMPELKDPFLLANGEPVIVRE